MKNETIKLNLFTKIRKNGIPLAFANPLPVFYRYEREIGTCNVLEMNDIYLGSLSLSEDISEEFYCLYRTRAEDGFFERLEFYEEDPNDDANQLKNLIP